MLWSGRKDLNLRPLAPHASALAGLRHAPICVNGDNYSPMCVFWQPFREKSPGFSAQGKEGGHKQNTLSGLPGPVVEFAQLAQFLWGYLTG